MPDSWNDPNRAWLYAARPSAVARIGAAVTTYGTINDVQRGRAAHSNFHHSSASRTAMNGARLNRDATAAPAHTPASSNRAADTRGRAVPDTAKYTAAKRKHCPP